MSIQVSITRKELSELRRVLREEEVVICLDDAAFVKVTLVAMEMLNCGCSPVARVERVGGAA